MKIANWVLRLLKLQSEYLPPFDLKTEFTKRIVNIQVSHLMRKEMFFHHKNILAEKMIIEFLKHDNLITYEYSNEQENMYPGVIFRRVTAALQVIAPEKK